MKIILFCQNPYAFGIMTPIRDLLQPSNHEYVWFLNKKLVQNFPHKEDNFTTSILELQLFESDVIFVPGNEVPHYLRGLKVQIFHGLAGEKKGHFRIRDYFDLYLTQGPYFTRKFNELRDKHRNFDVIETGWPKLDVYGKNTVIYAKEKKEVLESHKTDKIILYAPTFSPSLTSAPYLIEEIKDLAKSTGYLVFIKFHDLMEQQWIDKYQKLADEVPNIILKEEKNIVKFLIQADILISDTSSVIYEFLLLNKPVISFKNISENIQWDDSLEYKDLVKKVLENLERDSFKAQRALVNKEFHPYNDANSAQRMITAVEEYIAKKGVPVKRLLSLPRKIKIYSIFGKPIENPWSGNKINKLTALLITYNELENIDAVIENISFVDEIIIVDSFSSDGTIERIKQHKNVKLIQRPFKNYTEQKAFALKQASNDWVLFLDADERLTDKLKNEVLKTINNSTNMTVAYYFYRNFMFKNKRLYFSGWQKDKNYRLFRKSKVSFAEERIVHETLVVNGDIGILKNKLIHYSYKDYEDYKGKMIKYGQMKAQEELGKNYTPNLYHFIVRPLYKFFNHYIIRLGILDGRKGITICYLNALGVYSRYKELKRLRKLGRLPLQNDN
jgi:CDP-glycerol glycerophosphotransferase (TagB/SpsB family)/glycosyltransferase involved in cell wall biosynthesis